jgi:hypothetical protein
LGRGWAMTFGRSGDASLKSLVERGVLKAGDQLTANY